MNYRSSEEKKENHRREGEENAPLVPRVSIVNGHEAEKCLGERTNRQARGCCQVEKDIRRNVIVHDKGNEEAHELEGEKV